MHLARRKQEPNFIFQWFELCRNYILGLFSIDETDTFAQKSFIMR